jgi:hypothetical protein
MRSDERISQKISECFPGPCPMHFCNTNLSINSNSFTFRRPGFHFSGLEAIMPGAARIFVNKSCLPILSVAAHSLEVPQFSGTVYATSIDAQPCRVSIPRFSRKEDVQYEYRHSATDLTIMSQSGHGCKERCREDLAVNTSGKEYLLANLGFDGIILSNA